MEINIATLVELVASRAIVDKTVPDAANLRNGWRTDALMVDIDFFVVINCKEPAVYVQFGKQLLEKVKDLPEMASLAKLAVLRGERMLPLDSTREPYIVRLAEDLKRDITRLPEGPRKMRCKELLQYHKGIFFDACGRFDLAAKLQAQSAKEAERLSDKPGVAIARFCQASALLKNSLRQGEDIFLQTQFGAMERRLFEMSKTLSGSVLQVQWAEGNGPATMLEACVWLDYDHLNWENWLESTLSASLKLGEACRPGAEFSKALELARRDDLGADQALWAVAKSHDINERRATALLVIARRLLKAGKKDEARAAVAMVPEQGAQHVRAIAQRLLVS